jgi:hypothetical protein
VRYFKLKRDILAPAEALQTQYSYLPLFSQKGANMSKELLSRYNIGSVMSVFFQESLRGHAGYPFETIRKHSYLQSLTTISKVRVLYRVIYNHNHYIYV